MRHQAASHSWALIITPAKTKRYGGKKNKKPGKNKDLLKDIRGRPVGWSEL